MARKNIWMKTISVTVMAIFRVALKVIYVITAMFKVVSQQKQQWHLREIFNGKLHFFVQCSFWWVLILPRRYNADSHWCLLRFCRDQRNPWWLFSQNMGLNFLVMIDLSSFDYTNFFWWSWNCNWNRLDEGFSVR